MRVHQRSRSSSNHKSPVYNYQNKQDQMNLEKSDSSLKRRKKTKLNTVGNKGKLSVNLKCRIKKLNAKCEKLGDNSDSYLELQQSPCESNSATEDSESDIVDKMCLEKYEKPVQIKLKSLIRSEETKRKNLQVIVTKLKSHKQKQKLLINNLLEKNSKLDAEMQKNLNIIRQSSLKMEIESGKFQTIKCIQNNLMDELDTQNSLILDKVNNSNRLTIELSELKERYSSLETYYKNTNQELSILKAQNKQDETKQLDGTSEHEQNISILKNQFEENENKIYEEYQNKIFSANKNLEKERNCVLDLKDKLTKMEKQFAENKVKDEENQKKMETLETKLKSIQSEAHGNNENNEKTQKIYEMQKLIQQKELEISRIIELKDNDNKESVQGLKNQFSHMAETYEVIINYIHLLPFLF